LLTLSGTTEFYVNTFEGLPLIVISGELNERLKDAIEKAIPEIKKNIEASYKIVRASLEMKPSLLLFTFYFLR